jgi:hypothetical protein
MAITKSPPRDDLPPTTQAYHEVQLAFDFFNVELFDNKLPPCLLTFQRKGSGTYGYYSSKRFATGEGKTTDEIALSPRFFKDRSFVEVMSTLVHEMAHHWQAHYGTASRGGYHNRQWAEKMLWLGLRPSRTGAAGGKMTGQSMSHFILPGGRFAIAVEKLRAMVPALTWFDVDAAVRLPKGLAGSDLIPKPGLSGRRTVYRCPNLQCGDHASGKSTLLLICGKCGLQMEPDGLR